MSMTKVRGKFQKLTKGDPISELLECRNYDIEKMMTACKEQLLNSAAIKDRKIDPEVIYGRLKEFAESYPYLIPSASHSN